MRTDGEITRALKEKYHFLIPISFGRTPVSFTGGEEGIQGKFTSSGLYFLGEVVLSSPTEESLSLAWAGPEYSHH